VGVTVLDSVFPVAAIQIGSDAVLERSTLAFSRNDYGLVKRYVGHETLFLSKSLDTNGHICYSCPNHVDTS